MEFACKTVPLARVILETKGSVIPLCNSCENFECTFHIEMREVSVMGIIKKYRLLIRGNEPQQVMQSNGYIAPRKTDDIQSP